MSEYYIQESTLNKIGNQIRNLTDTQDKLSLLNMKNNLQEVKNEINAQTDLIGLILNKLS